MIQNKTSADRTVSGNLMGQKIQMGVADMAHILNVVTDLYADREMAPVREYSTNALDAHIEAGVTRPIEVTTPNILNGNSLVIRDYGVGLSLKDIEEIYSQYGASTKRDTNSQTGMLGLGCKSALTYSDTFTVTSVKDGVRIQVVVSRDATGASMKVVDTSSTADPNGTTVAIPAKRGNDFERKAKFFFKHWRKGTVLLNGAEPAFMPGVQWVTDDICINSEGGYNPQSYVVMGGVPYPADIPHDLGWGKSLTAFVPIGAVDFAPSREALMDTPTTTDTLTGITSTFQNGMRTAVEKDIAAAGSPAEAIQRRYRWLATVPNRYVPSTAAWNGKIVPDSYRVTGDVFVVRHYGSKQSSHIVYRPSLNASIPIAALMESVWVHGYEHASFTATTKKKLIQWCDENDVTYPENYVLSKDRPDTEWLTNLTEVAWSEIKAIKLPRKARTSSGRIPGSYDIWEDGDYSEDTPADDIDTSKQIFWTIGRGWSGVNLAKKLAAEYPGCTLVMLRSGREDKFQRLFPAAREANKALKSLFEAWVKGLNKDDARAYAVAQAADSRLAQLDLSKVEDPEIAAARKVLDRNIDSLVNQIKEWRKLGHYYSPEDSDMENPLDKYKLLPDSYYFRRDMHDAAFAEHVYNYMNDAYRRIK